MNEIVTEALTFTREAQTVLRGVNVTLKSGEKVGLVGANGAGKTTLLELLAGTLRPSEGRLLAVAGVASGLRRAAHRTVARDGVGSS